MRAEVTSEMLAGRREPFFILKTAFRVEFRMSVYTENPIRFKGFCCPQETYRYIDSMCHCMERRGSLVPNPSPHFVSWCNGSLLQRADTTVGWSRQEMV